MTFRRNPQFDVSLRKAVADATRDGGKVVKEQVKSLLSDESGRSEADEPPAMGSGDLFRSIEDSDLSDGADSLEVRVGSELVYSRWLEAGTWKMAPRPFLRPGLTLSQKAVMEKFRDRLKGGGGNGD